MTIWIVGAGIVGRRLTRMLEDRPVAFHDPRGDPLSAVVEGDVVVMCHPDRHAPLVERIGRRRASVVTIGDDFDDAKQLLALGPIFESSGASLVVGAGMSPGLSGLLARHLAGQLASIDEIHVAIHGTAGPACARGHHRSLSRWAVAWHEGTWVDYLGGSGRELCWFPEPVGAKDCYRAGNADPLLLHAGFPTVTRISARRSARRRDRFTARLPMLSPPHQEGGVGALRVEVRGAGPDGARECMIVGVAELVGTTAAATLAAFASLAADRRLPHGLVVAGDEASPTLEALELVQSFGVRLQEFTGVPQPV